MSTLHNQNHLLKSDKNLVPVNKSFDLYASLVSCTGSITCPLVSTPPALSPPIIGDQHNHDLPPKAQHDQASRHVPQHDHVPYLSMTHPILGTHHDQAIDLAHLDHGPLDLMTLADNYPDFLQVDGNLSLSFSSNDDLSPVTNDSTTSSPTSPPVIQPQTSSLPLTRVMFPTLACP